MPSTAHKVLAKSVKAAAVIQHGTQEWSNTLSQQNNEMKQRANSHRRSTPDEDELNHHKLFHTIHGTSDGFTYPSPQNVHWFLLQELVVDLFKNQGQLGEGQLRKTHEIVRVLLNSEFGQFVYDRFKSQLLPKAMGIIKATLDEQHYLSSLELAWNTFFHTTLPTLDCMLYQVEIKFLNKSIRKATLVAFRDYILINGPLEANIQRSLDANEPISESVVHLVMVMQAVFECFPPSKNKLEMERMAALLVSPYIGYLGLYNRGKIVIQSKERERISSTRSNSLPDGEAKLNSRSIALLGHHQRPSKLAQSRKISLQPVLEKSPNKHNINYMLATIYK